MSSRVMRCLCRHEFQDAHYGRNQRAHTFGTKRKVWRCTVCLAERPATGKLPKEAKE